MTRPIRLMIIGSCVSRDAVEVAAPGSVELAGYYARSSFASLTAAPAVDQGTLERIASPFQRRMVRADMDKSVWGTIAANDYDILLVDFIDERFNLLRRPEGGLVTLSNEYLSANPSREGQTIRSQSMEHLQLWERGIRRLIDAMQAQGTLGKLRINKAFWAIPKNVDTVSDEAKKVQAANQFLRNCYAMLATLLPEEAFITYEDSVMQADPAHKWGIAPFHYIPAFYRATIDALQRARAQTPSAPTLAIEVRGDTIIGCFDHFQDGETEYAFYLMKNDQRLAVQWYSNRRCAQFTCGEPAAQLRVQGFWRAVGSTKPNYVIVPVPASEEDPATPALSLEIYRASTQLRRLATRLTGDSDARRRGQEIMRAKAFELGPFASVTLPDFSDWETSGLENRSWLWRLNWLSFIGYLVSWHAESADDRALDTAAAAVDAWARTYLETEPPQQFEFAWHDHGTALRAEQVALLIHYAANAAPGWTANNMPFIGRAMAFCNRHAEILSRDDFYSARTNHGLEQARVLLLLASTSGTDGAARRRSMDVALGRLDAELRFSFTDEGVHVENSPAYHVFVFKVFLHIIAEYPMNMLGGLGERFKEIATKALEYTTWILRPDGKLPILGDTEEVKVTDSFANYFGTDLTYQQFRYALTQGRLGLPPQKAVKMYPLSGYAIFRQEWPDASSYTQALHAVFKAGSISGYHNQQDEGNLIACYGGEDWLIDSGMFNYEPKSPIRKYMRSRAAHNVVMVTQTNTVRDSNNLRSAWRTLSWSDDPLDAHFEAECLMYEHVRLVRRVQLTGNELRVSDQVSMTDGVARDVILAWHIPQDKSVQVFEGGQVDVTSRSGRSMVVRMSGDPIDQCIVRSGEKDGTVISVVSVAANQYQPSKLLRVVAAKRTSFSLQTTFAFRGI